MTNEMAQSIVDDMNYCIGMYKRNPAKFAYRAAKADEMASELRENGFTVTYNYVTNMYKIAC